MNIRYSDIYNTRSLVELAGQGIGLAPDPSYGTHFFQDLMEANIYPLAIFLDDKDVIFKQDFFYKTPNQLDKIAPKENYLEACIRIIDVASYREGHHIDIVMDNQKGQAVAYLHDNDHTVLADKEDSQS